jgi:hypothetical protein
MLRGVSAGCFIICMPFTSGLDCIPNSPCWLFSFSFYGHCSDRFFSGMKVIERALVSRVLRQFETKLIISLCSRVPTITTDPQVDLTAGPFPSDCEIADDELMDIYAPSPSICCAATK